MLTRTVLTALLLLLAPAAVWAQQPDSPLTAAVRISGTRGGTPVRGSGFVVGLEGGKAAIATASHVIEGVQQLKVTFAADRTESFPAGTIFGMDGGNPNGLAALEVRGAIPAGVTPLILEAESRSQPGDSLLLVGFPEMAVEPRLLQRVLSARRGTYLLIDQEIGEGFSGGSVLQRGKVVGIVTVTDGETTYAVNSLVLRESLAGWGIKLAAPAAPKCTGETRPDRYGIVAVHICPETFTMGAAADDPYALDHEKPAHPVTLSSYWISQTEITNKQYAKVRPHESSDLLPVTNVDWHEAQEACAYFGNGRLPTEAQWEYAARAGSQSTWFFGNDGTALGKYAWYGESQEGEPHSVAGKDPNPWGLYDMYGNVFEWVGDWYESPYPSEAQTDPSGPPESPQGKEGDAGVMRVLRGGAAVSDSQALRSSARGMLAPNGRSPWIGFRCVWKYPS